MGVRVAILSLVLVNAIKAQDVVNTTSGDVRGQWVQPLGVIQFLGIPYAEAPLGELRFKPPVRKARMEGIYNAYSNSMVCPQPTTELSSSSTTKTEDCLRLDIYVPRTQAVVSGNPNFPVMIWIYGGGYQLGDSSTYNSFAIASLGQVIVVTLNYRLGIFGFLDTADETSVGNFGLRDQCSAIEWVVDNIGEFGGDVSRVTIFGESAGASSVTQLAMSSLCKGKFHRVIAQSGNPAAGWAFNADPKKSSEALAKHSNCPTESAALVKCLRNLTWEEILDIQVKEQKPDELTWVPSYRSDVFPDNPLDIIKGKESLGLSRFRSLDYLSGVCNEEGEIGFVMALSGSNNMVNPTINTTDAILTDEHFDTRLRGLLSLFLGLDEYEQKRMFPATRFQYTDWKNINDDYSNAKMMIQLYSDIGFNKDGVAVANLHSKASRTSEEVRGKTYFYQFKPKGSWFPTKPWTQGSTHGQDIYFVFNFVQYVNGMPSEIQLSNQMIEYWTNFAKTGSPNEPTRTMSEPVWPRYDKEKGEFIELDLNLSNESISAFPYARRIAFWEKRFQPQLEQVRADREKMEMKCKIHKGNVILNSAVTLSSSCVLKLLILGSVIPAVLSYMN